MSCRIDCKAMDKFRRVYFISFITCESVLSIILGELAEIERGVEWYSSIILLVLEGCGGTVGYDISTEFSMAMVWFPCDA